MTEPIIIHRQDSAYDTARRVWNLAADVRPAAVAVASSAEQVQQAILFARRRGLRVAPVTTGHSALALPALEDTLLLRTALHDQARIDPIARRARVKAGAEWHELVTAAAPHGLGALHGSSPDVGIVGYTLGGGMSFYGRRHGLAANHVTSIEVVTADARLRTVDSEHEPDLFWALRGGRAGFGVVTALEFALFPIERVHAGALFWPIGEAPRVVRAWRDWCRTAPDSATTSLRLLRLPPLPEVPEPLRDVPVVTIDGAILEDAPTAERLLAPLRALGTPMIDDWRSSPPEAVLRMHLEPEEPTPAQVDHVLLHDLDDAGVDAFVAASGAVAPLVLTELRQLGGAFARRPAGAGARGHLEGSFALFALGVPMTPEVGDAIDERLRSLVRAMRPWSTGTVYGNFDERGGPAQNAFAPRDYRRLQALRAAWDPDELLVSTHRVEPAPPAVAA